MNRPPPDCPFARTGRRACRTGGRWVRRGATALAVLSSGCAPVGPGLAPAPGADLVPRFAQAYVQLLPIGRLLDAAAAQDTRWPLADRADWVSAAQLGCMRRALSSAELTPRQHQAARQYAEAYPDTLAADLQVLEAGAARLIGEAMLAGAGAMVAPVPASARENDALAAFVTEPRFATLRRATGLDPLTDAGTGADPAQRGRALGQRLLTRHMTDAFLHCHIPVQLLY